MTTDTGMVEQCVRAAMENVRQQLDGQPIPGSGDQLSWSSSTGNSLDMELVVRAVLECLRTPTPEMVEAMKVYVGGHERAVIRWMQASTPDAQSKIWAEQVKPTQDALFSSFTSMIDRALSPSKGDGE